MSNIADKPLQQMTLADTEWAERWVRDRVDKQASYSPADGWSVPTKGMGVIRFDNTVTPHGFPDALERWVANAVREKLAVVGLAPNPEWALGLLHPVLVPERPRLHEVWTIRDGDEQDLILKLLEMHGDVGNGPGHRLAARLVEQIRSRTSEMNAAADAIKGGE